MFICIILINFNLIIQIYTYLKLIIQFKNNHLVKFFHKNIIFE